VRLWTWIGGFLVGLGLALIVCGTTHAEAKMSFSMQDEALITCHGNPAHGYAAARDLGATWIRLNLLEWRPCGDAVQNTLDAGFKAQVTLAGSRTYMKQQVLAHRHQVNVWSIWNEPELAAWRCCSEAQHKRAKWGTLIPPRNYGRLFRWAYRTIKRLDPGAKVLYGELSPHGMSNRRTWKSGKTWLAKSVRGPRPIRADGLAIHPYWWL